MTSFLSDGFRVVSGSDDLSCRVWDVPSAVELSSLTEHTDYIRALAPSKLNPDLFVTGNRCNSHLHLTYDYYTSIDQILA